jgi:hypothetical protein
MWWTWPVLVERKTGDGPVGPVFATGTVHSARVTQKRKMVRSGDGTEVVSEARINFPAVIPRIPVGSLVTLPSEFSGARVEVIAEQLHHAGPATPNFYSIDV